MSQTLQFSGKVYRGYDEGLQKSISVSAGQTLEVSDEKATQLLKDFPKLWRVVDEAKKTEKEKPEKPEKEKPEKPEKEKPEQPEQEEPQPPEEEKPKHKESLGESWRSPVVESKPKAKVKKKKR